MQDLSKTAFSTAWTTSDGNRMALLTVGGVSGILKLAIVVPPVHCICIAIIYARPVKIYIALAMQMGYSEAGGEEMNILEELWYGNIQFRQESIDKDSDHARASHALVEEKVNFLPRSDRQLKACWTGNWRFPFLRNGMRLFPATDWRPRC